MSGGCLPVPSTLRFPPDGKGITALFPNSIDTDLMPPCSHTCQILIAASLTFLCVPITSAKAAAPSMDKPLTIVLVGDSTVADPSSARPMKAGWGWSLAKWAKKDAVVKNEAVSGTSSLSFRTKGYWDKALADKPDWILIQFGHNDMPSKGADRASDPKTTYREHLHQFIEEAQQVGAKPILVTSVCRRTFDADGKLKDQLVNYSKAAKAVAAEMKIPCLDLHDYSRGEFLKMGPEAVAALGPADRETDQTHFSLQGSAVIAFWVLTLLQNEVPELASHFDAPPDAALPAPASKE